VPILPFSREEQRFKQLQRRLALYRLVFGQPRQEDLVEYKQGGYAYPEMIPGTFKTKANVFNDYEVDRLGQKTNLYSGIKTFPLQDIAMMENQWGPIAHRWREHLTSYDYMIIHVRQRLLKAAKNLAQGVEPAEPWHPEAYAYRREMATGATREEAIANVKAKALQSGLSQKQGIAQST
jgi:phthalate 4,5-dioxygenase